MSAFPRLFVMRHGQTEWNAARRMQGWRDSALTDQGVAEALRQRNILSGCDLTGCTAISSPQVRALHTAALALQGLVHEIRTDERLKEIGVGEWTGMTADQLELRGATFGDDSGSLLHYDRAPGGEGFEALYRRCKAFLDDLRGPAILVTHGVTSRMLRLIVLGRAIRELDDIPGGQGVVYHLEDGRQQCLPIGT
ncbi:histidine phosphatase family protein [Sulfitobacter sp. LCG007]